MTFEAQGRIEWAILAPASVETLREIMSRHAWDIDEDVQSWCIVKGKKKHSAVIETAPGSSGVEIGLAEAISKKLGTTVYALGFAGYDDPDHGLPSITRYEPGKKGALIWMAPYDGDDAPPPPKTVAGPKGVPCDDPFDFADALGCKLRSYFR